MRLISKELRNTYLVTRPNSWRRDGPDSPAYDMGTAFSPAATFNAPLREDPADPLDRSEQAVIDEAIDAHARFSGLHGEQTMSLGRGA